MTAFTKQHYEAVAKVLAARIKVERWAENDDALDLLMHIASDFARLFTADDPAFDPEQFLKACLGRTTMTAFTKQHYEVIAKVIAEHVGIERWVNNDDTLNLLTDITNDFVRLFSEDSPVFDSEQFVEACSNKE